MPYKLSEGTRQKLSHVCEKYYVRRLSIFGSTLRGEAKADSDPDILVEFIPGHVPGFGFARLQEELSAILRRRLDLRTPFDLSRYFREDVLKEARPIYSINGLNVIGSGT
ncbi:MAG: nucleotidyltransferase family protein [Ignavibacteria bacterium]|nr:MAG: nucleotidyltransferase family protein [Ignavibacteria bacterium]